jgi:hypothetical protein
VKLRIIQQRNKLFLNKPIKKKISWRIGNQLILNWQFYPCQKISKFFPKQLLLKCLKNPYHFPATKETFVPSMSLW